MTDDNFAALTCLVNWSAQLMRMFSAVAGLLKLKPPIIPASLLADLTASLIAKKMEDDRNRGGSPIAWKIKMHFKRLYGCHKV